jgi:hypothetical protein
MVPASRGNCTVGVVSVEHAQWQCSEWQCSHCAPTRKPHPRAAQHAPTHLQQQHALYNAEGSPPRWRGLLSCGSRRSWLRPTCRNSNCRHALLTLRRVQQQANAPSADKNISGCQHREPHLRRRLQGADTHRVRYSRSRLSVQQVLRTTVVCALAALAALSAAASQSGIEKRCPQRQMWRMPSLAPMKFTGRGRA